MRPIVLAVMVSTLSACGGDEDTGPAVDAPQACRDVLDAYGDACRDCFVDEDAYQVCYNEWLEFEVDGSCDNVHGVRDVDLLYDECIPYIDTAPCEVIFPTPDTYFLDSSCVEQLEL